MPRPHRRNHVPTKTSSIQPSTPDTPRRSSPANRLSPTLNRPNQIIEIINDSSSPPTPTPPQIPNPSHPLHLPPLLSRPTQTTLTMSSEHQRPQYQPSPDARRASDQRRQWPEPHLRPDPPPPSHVFHLRHTTVYSRPYGYSSNGQPLFLQFGAPGAADAARALQSIPCVTMPPGFADPRDDYPHYPPRHPRQYEDDRYEPYEAYQNYESYDGRELDRRPCDPRRSDEYEGVRYRHSTGHGGGPGTGPPPCPQPGPVADRECHDDAPQVRDEEEEGHAEKRRQRLPTTRTYRDFSHVPSVSGHSEERKRQYSSEDLRVKRARLNWSDELHAKFLGAVEELGVDKAVPTSIMKLMKVDGLTRENVASHLQKYRGTIKKEKDEEERRLLLKAAAKSVLEDGGDGKMTEEEVIKAVAKREESFKAPAKKRGGKDR